MKVGSIKRGRRWNGIDLPRTYHMMLRLGKHERCGVETYEHPTSPWVCRLPVGHLGEHAYRRWASTLGDMVEGTFPGKETT